MCIRDRNNTRIAIFGLNTNKAATDAGQIVDISAPSPEAPSMIMAIENYIKLSNK